jgi:DNA polymerase-3 subunit gamma/tau
LAFIEGRALDFVEQDAASHNSVDDIRQLRENVVLTPMAGGRKVHLLDEVHMLSNAAVNALLKTLEEPPPHVIFVLATTEAHKIPATIISRCQRFDLKRIPMSAAVERLAFVAEKEGFMLDRISLDEIARATTGSLRDAVNALEQVVTYYGRAPSPEQVREALGLTVDARSGQLSRLALAGDLAGGLRLIGEVKDDGVEMKHFGKQVVKYLRGLLLSKAGATEALDLPTEMAAEVQAEAKKLSKDEILRALQIFGRIDWKEDTTSLPLELAFVDFVSSVSDSPRSEPIGPSAVQERREPRFSIPAADLDTVESTVATASLQPPTSPKEEPAAPTPIRPEVAEEPAPTAANGAGTGELFERVRAALRTSDENKTLSALLNGSCEVTSAEGDKVVLGFYHTFHLEQIEKGPFRPVLEKAFSAELGRTVSVVYEHAPRGPRPDTPKSKGGHLVQAARELGARAVPPED